MIRELKFILFAFVILGLQSCSPKVVPYSGEVNFIYKEAQGTIGLKSIGYGKNLQEAIIDAQKNSFNILFFKGIPGTELNIPLIDNENDAKSKHSDYFKKFFDQGNYKSFIMSSTESSNLMKIKGGKKITIDLKINYNSLRKDLEQNQITRKFGY
jgi:hypothetical protein